MNGQKKNVSTWKINFLLASKKTPHENSIEKALLILLQGQFLRTTIAKKGRTRYVLIGNTCRMKKQRFQISYWPYPFKVGLIK